MLSNSGNKGLTLCNVYTFFWCLYYLLGVLTDGNGSVSSIILLINLAFSFYFFFTININYSLPIYIKGLNYIVTLFTVYAVFRLTEGNFVTLDGIVVKRYDWIKQFYISAMPMYAYYYFSSKNQISEKWFSYWIIVFFVVVVLLYFSEQRLKLQQAISEGSTAEAFTNNTGYLFLSLFPALLISDLKNLTKTILAIIISFFIILCLKRGAILVFSICLLWLFYQFFKQSKRKGRFKVLIISFSVIAAISFFVKKQIATNDYFNQRIEYTLEGNTSNRDIMYKDMWNYFRNDADLSQFVIGNGINGTDKLFGVGAHNDWLEIMIDMGLVGLIFYSLYWLYYYHEWRRMKKSNILYMIMGFLFLENFMKTFFSFSINAMPLYELPVLGYLLYTYKKKAFKLT